MLKKFLKEVVIIVVGKQAEEIADLLNNKNYVNEFIIAKKLGLTINQTRNILYKISDYGLVSFMRKKDKRKGWYTYFWRIEILKSLEFLRGTLIKGIDQLNYQIRSRETKKFYVCERCNTEFTEENALLYNFTCNECGDIFTLKDNQKFLKELVRDLDKLKKKLVFVDEEIRKEKDRIEKERLKELKKEERKKKKMKDVKKAEAKKKAIKSKKEVKKKPKKKIKKLAKKKKVSKKTTKKNLKKKVKNKTKKKYSKKISKKKILKSKKK